MTGVGELEAQGSKANSSSRLSLAFLDLQAVWLALLTHLVEYFPFSHHASLLLCQRTSPKDGSPLGLLLHFEH